MAAAIVAFGLSNTYWVLIVARCVQGFMNGNIGITKVALADLTDSTNMATGEYVAFRGETTDTQTVFSVLLHPSHVGHGRYHRVGTEFAQHHLTHF